MKPRAFSLLIFYASSKPIHQAEWIANVVPIPKKDRKVRMCMDFKDLNKACPKDDFPLPHINVLVDNTVGSTLCLSWMVSWDIIKSRSLLGI